MAVAYFVRLNQKRLLRCSMIMRILFLLPILLLFSCDSDPEVTVDNTFLDKDWVVTKIDDLEVSCERNFIEQTWKFRSDGVWSIIDNCFTDGQAGFWDYNSDGNIKPQEFGVYFVFTELKRTNVVIEFYNNLDEIVETREFALVRN